MRWMILSLLVAVTVINYLDRLLLSVLSPILRDYFHFNESLYGNVSAAFQIAYAFGFLALGKFVDRYGTKVGLGVAAAIWSTASLMHSTVSSASQFGAWRALLGVAEGANFPACTKAVVEWFPPEERAFAIGIFNAGVNVASVIGPPLFVALAASYGWRTCFIAVSALGFLWLFFWTRLYRAPPTTVQQITRPITLTQALHHRQAWGFVLGKMLVDPSFFFMLSWLPLYLKDVRKFQMSEIGWALPWIYFMSALGSIIAGWSSGFLMRQGWSKRRARISTMLFCAILVPWAIGLALITKGAATILYFSVAAAAHQAFSSIAYTAPGDVFPSYAVGTVQGLGGFSGSISSVFFSFLLPGYLIPFFGYSPIYVALSFGYLAAVGVYASAFGDFAPVLIAPRAPSALAV